MENKIIKVRGRISKMTAAYIIAAMVLATLFLCVMFYLSLMERIYADSSLYLNELAYNVADAIHSDIVEQLKRADRIRKRIFNKDITSIQMLSELIREEESYYTSDNIRIIVADSKNNFYSSHGNAGIPNITDMPAKENFMEKQVFVTFSVNNENPGCEVMFIRPLETPVEINGGIQLTHIAIVRSMDMFDYAFRQLAYNEQSENFIVGKDGHKIYRYEKSYNIIGNTDNAAEKLKEMKYLYKSSYENLLEAVNEDTGCCMLLSSDYAEKYYVSYMPIPEYEWSILSIVPADEMGQNMREFMNVAVLGMFGIAVAVTMFITLAVFMETRYVISKDIMEREISNNITLRMTARQAESANRAKTVYLSNMSHDIRTPVNGIMGMTEIAIKNVNDTAKVSDCLAKIKSTSKHLLSLLNDVLDISRIESGALNIENKAFCLNELIMDCYNVVSAQAIEKQLRISKRFAVQPDVMLSGDELHLRQIIINILGNAVKFTPDGGKVTFAVKAENVLPDECDITIIISDTGIGMDKEFLQKIYEPYSQAEQNTVNKKEGTGLGMSIVKKLLDHMGGTIKIESEQGVGSKFTINLRMRLDMERHEDPNKADEHIDLAQMRILLVEDMAMNLEIAQYMLEDNGAVVTTAVNGAEAVSIYENSPEYSFDLILMDVMMPKMNGLEASRKIRESKKEDAESIPIIAMTANVYSDDKKAIKEAGMNGHISKPVEMAKMLKTVKKYKDAISGNP